MTVTQYAEAVKLAEKIIDDYMDGYGNGIDQDEAANLAQIVYNMHEWFTANNLINKIFQKE